MSQRSLLLFAIGALWCSAAVAQTTNPGYDKALADSLGADEYGMKSYVFVILKTGPAKIDDQQKIGELFRGHMDNINRLVEMKKLIIAGPFGENDRAYRGLFVFDSKDKQEVSALLQTDPAVKEKLLEVELFEWYGSAALPTYLKLSDKVTKVKP
ncbi:YciI family protein [Parapedobacter sp. DT-150]|uniref:YciI family protein n=1 Tax=Parapedobacter sp. DT-150 TaxID=3396162 RepID=UPI003F1A4D4C